MLCIDKQRKRSRSCSMFACHLSQQHCPTSNIGEPYALSSHVAVVNLVTKVQAA